MTEPILPILEYVKETLEKEGFHYMCNIVDRKFKTNARRRFADYIDCRLRLKDTHLSAAGGNATFGHYVKENGEWGEYFSYNEEKSALKCKLAWITSECLLVEQFGEATVTSKEYHEKWLSPNLET